jgi:MerR family transcriptional regulator, repressor of the yfmOP operon
VSDAPETDAPNSDELLRIQEVADLVGLTPRSIRYYEEVGLLEPAARSEGAYRLYDPDDLARLQFIKGLRDDAGFSLAEIGRLLEDETARAANRQRFRESRSTIERRAVLRDGIERIDRQVATLQAKIDRLQSMVAAAGERRSHLEQHLDDLRGR